MTRFESCCLVAIPGAYGDARTTSGQDIIKEAGASSHRQSHGVRVGYIGAQSALGILILRSLMKVRILASWIGRVPIGID